jgi:hypothetical protein
VYGDCAVNVSPTSKDLASIAACSADTAAAFGIEPRVAMLSYSTMGSGAGPDVSNTTLHDNRGDGVAFNCVRTWPVLEEWAGHCAGWSLGGHAVLLNHGLWCRTRRD